MDEFHRGSCLCGTVKYGLSSELKAVTHCHCGQCRKSHGAAFATYASTPASTLSIMTGTDSLMAYESSKGVTRRFCCRCGSSLFWTDSTGAFSDWVSIALGTLDTPLRPRKQKHVHVGSKADWHDISDQHPQTD
jgi:hypothetical protein